MEENNRKGPGIFYAVVGVATLVVAIIGATFAYFSAADQDAETVQGTAATAGLSLEVTKVSTDATGGLIPIAETLLTNALDGDAETDNKMCVDQNGNTVCQVYKLAVTNDGSATTTLNGSLTLTATGYKNLKWANINKNAGLTSDAELTDVGANLNASSVTEVTLNETFTAGQTKYYYVMIYINEINDKQDDLDKGSFTGLVAFNSANGSGTTATFSA